MVFCIIFSPTKHPAMPASTRAGKYIRSLCNSPTRRSRQLRTKSMKNRIGISGWCTADDYDGSVRTDAGGEPQEGGAFTLTQEGQPSDDSVESFIGTEDVGIRDDKPRPIAIAGYCCPLLGCGDGFR